MRETEFWQRMTKALGPGYARVWAEQQQLAGLGNRTVADALAAGLECKAVWRVVSAELELAPSER